VILTFSTVLQVVRMPSHPANCPECRDKGGRNIDSQASAWLFFCSDGGPSIKKMLRRWLQTAVFGDRETPLKVFDGLAGWLDPQPSGRHQC